VFSLAKHRAYLGLALAVLLVASITFSPTLVFADSSPSIELAGIRWNRFPLKVLVDMNQWSNLDYVFAVREAIDIWVCSMWTYSEYFNDTTLEALSYTFYVSDVNATSSYDIFITFTSDEIYGNVVGLTSYEWNPITRAPRPPVTINLTTYSGTASPQFLKNIVMHEFGHSLGLGHASQKNTINGPELMYFRAPAEGTVFPSTLDLYALSVLYQGDFSSLVQLPASMPYEMVQPATNILPDIVHDPAEPGFYQIFQSILEALSVIIHHVLESDRVYLVVLAAFLFIYIFASALGGKEQEKNKS
jgi:hypothetical protein